MEYEFFHFFTCILNCFFLQTIGTTTQWPLTTWKNPAGSETPLYYTAETITRYDQSTAPTNLYTGVTGTTRAWKYPQSPTAAVPTGPGQSFPPTQTYNPKNIGGVTQTVLDPATGQQVSALFQDPNLLSTSTLVSQNGPTSTYPSVPPFGTKVSNGAAASDVYPNTGGVVRQDLAGAASAQVAPGVQDTATAYPTAVNPAVTGIPSTTYYSLPAQKIQTLFDPWTSQGLSTVSTSYNPITQRASDIFTSYDPLAQGASTVSTTYYPPTQAALTSPTAYDPMGQGKLTATATVDSLLQGTTTVYTVYPQAQGRFTFSTSYDPLAQGGGATVPPQYDPQTQGAATAVPPQYDPQTQGAGTAVPPQYDPQTQRAGTAVPPQYDPQTQGGATAVPPQYDPQTQGGATAVPPQYDPQTQGGATAVPPQYDPQTQGGATAVPPQYDPQTQGGATAVPPQYDPQTQGGATAVPPQYDPQTQVGATAVPPQYDPQTQVGATAVPPQYDPQTQVGATTAPPQNDPQSQGGPTTGKQQYDPQSQGGVATMPAQNKPQSQGETISSSPQIQGGANAATPDYSQIPKDSTVPPSYDSIPTTISAQYNAIGKDSASITTPKVPSKVMVDVTNTELRIPKVGDLFITTSLPVQQTSTSLGIVTQETVAYGSITSDLPGVPATKDLTTHQQSANSHVGADTTTALPTSVRLASSTTDNAPATATPAPLIPTTTAAPSVSDTTATSVAVPVITKSKSSNIPVTSSLKTSTVPDTRKPELTSFKETLSPATIPDTSTSAAFSDTTVAPKVIQASTATKSSTSISTGIPQKAYLEAMCIKAGYFIDRFKYVGNPNNCDGYFRCMFFLGNFIFGREMHCPYGYYYNNNFGSCIESHKIMCTKSKCFRGNKFYGIEGNCRAMWRCNGPHASPDCCPTGMRSDPFRGCVPDLSCTDTCPEVASPYTPGKCPKLKDDYTDRLHMEYIEGRGYQTRACAEGTKFDPISCLCVIAPATNRQGVFASLPKYDDACKPEIHLSFNDGVVRDSSGNNVDVDAKNIAISNGAAWFNGESKITIWRFKAATLGQQLTIAMRFKPDDTTHSWSKPQHLISNCDKKVDPSVDVYISRQDNKIHYYAQTNTQIVSLNSPYNSSTWNNIEMKYDGNQLVGNTNGQIKAHTLYGDMKTRPSAIVIGFCRAESGFKGWIDEVKIYFCTPIAVNKKHPFS